MPGIPWTMRKNLGMDSQADTLRTEAQNTIDDGREAPGLWVEGKPPHTIKDQDTEEQPGLVVHDMVFGTNTSGFGWDDDRQIVSHPDAKQYRYKPFPHLMELTKVWGKDRATGGLLCEKAIDDKREALGEVLAKVDGLTDDEFVLRFCKGLGRVYTLTKGQPSKALSGDRRVDALRRLFSLAWAEEALCRMQFCCRNAFLHNAILLQQNAYSAATCRTMHSFCRNRNAEMHLFDGYTAGRGFKHWFGQTSILYRTGVPTMSGGTSNG
ncbi:uncharacterized protein G2W53_026793 [Senna tora]|uniref:Uncharacterized protein n=1 Tax=Senna tora TaxID=362788 RepID=A0A834TFM5_9FABA|nr:uncharacterized protein G2W53_026793 [Senna tora]